LSVNPSSFLSQEVCVYEKLDGTNFGIRCDGVYFGRRQRVESDTYQRIHLGSDVPDADTIQSIKRTIGNLIGIDDPTTSLPQMIVYGELMCNSDRFHYQQRGLFQKKWLAFGVVFSNCSGSNKNFVRSKDLLDRLLAAGLYGYSIGLKTAICLNPKLASILENAGGGGIITCAPFVAKGSLREVCLTQKDLMMKNKDLEGLVITGMNGFISKWKTGQEDESKGSKMLLEIRRKYSPCILRLAGIDDAIMDCFVDVAGNKPEEVKKMYQKHKKNNNKYEPSYTKSTLERKLVSAMTKYDSVDSYFEPENRMTELIIDLVYEMNTDLQPMTENEMRSIRLFVDQSIVRAYKTFVCKKKKK